MQHKLLVSVQARAARASWQALLEVAPHLGKNWVLVGGQMVTVYAAEQPDSMLRETTDADIVMDLRMQADGLDQADRALRSLGFDQRVSTVTNLAHRYVRGEAKIDILSPDHLGNRNPLKLGLGRSLAVRGASRALARARQVSVEFEDSTALVRVPSPVGALVVKASALYYHMSGEGRSVAAPATVGDQVDALLGSADYRIVCFQCQSARCMATLIQETLQTDSATFWERDIRCYTFQYPALAPRQR